MRTTEEYHEMVEAALPAMLPQPMGYGEEAIRAARYSLLAGGKRLRPALTLAACESVGGDARDALHAACAIECIHTYSLIHDDLPALDDDDMRRGRPSCHARYGEATAIIAGDGLNTHAFWLVAEGARRAGKHVGRHMRALAHIASGAGFYGMVSGQAADLALTRDGWGDEALAFIHANKTAALFRASVLAGAEIGGADEGAIRQFDGYGLHLGLAFQAADDILDVTGTAEQLGKTPGKDERDGKLTYVALHGMEAAVRHLQRESAAAAEIAEAIPGDTALLAELARSLANRTR